MLFIKILKLIKKAFIYEKKLFVCTIIYSVLKAISSLLFISKIEYVIEALSFNDFSIALIEIVKFLCIPLSIEILSLLLLFFINYITRISTNKIQTNYVDDALKIDYHFVQSGEILNLKKKSMAGHPIFYIYILGEIITYILRIFGLVYIFTNYSFWFIIVFLLIVILTLFIKVIQRNKEFNYKNDIVDQQRKADYIYNLMTDLKFGKDIRINNYDSLLVNRLNVHKNSLHLKLRKMSLFNLIVNNLISFINSFFILVVYVLCSYGVYSKSIDLSTYIVIINSTILLNSSLINIFDCFVKLVYFTKSDDFINDYSNFVYQNSSIYNTNKIKNKSSEAKNLLFEFKNVSFSYPNNENKILNNISFKINQLDKIGIIGLNGAGKTTLLKLILRLYIPTSGVILLNGIDINTIPLDEYLKKISIVLQDYFIFSYTLKENIVFDSDFDKEKFNKSLEISGLIDKIKKLKFGINTIMYKDIDEKGIELSGGENQKISLSRAFYKNSKFFVFDEASSNLDPISEYKLFVNLKKELENKSALIISHKMTFMSLCNEIIVLDKGKIVEFGTHEELIEKKGKYYNLSNLLKENYGGNANEKK